LANIKSAKKRAALSEVRRLRNRAIRSTVHTAVRRFERAVANGDAAADNAVTFREACRQLDRAVTRGVMHRNAAARKKSRLAKKLAQHV
jgi:small subunit ribosomal protein S20